MTLPADDANTGARWEPAPDGLTPGDRERFEQCYREGMQLLEQVAYDHDRAHELFYQCVLADPDNVRYV